MKRRIRFLVLVFALLGLGAGDTDLAPTTDTTEKIVCFGDSTTAPRAVEGKALRVYADLLREALDGVTVVNAGTPGDTSAKALARFNKDVAAEKPDTVIIQFGINDAAVDVWKEPPATGPRVPLTEYARNLRLLVDGAREAGSEVILMTPNPLRWTRALKERYGRPPYRPEDPDGLNVLLRRYASVVRDVAQETKVPLVDVFAAFQRCAAEDDWAVDRMLLDGMHPNEKGHRLIAGMLSRVIAGGNPDAARPAPGATAIRLPTRMRYTEATEGYKYRL